MRTDSITRTYSIDNIGMQDLKMHDYWIGNAVISLDSRKLCNTYHCRRDYNCQVPTQVREVAQ
jgi:hypothetical protein